MRKFIKKGTMVKCKFGFAKVVGIEFCENEGDRYGIKVDRCYLKDKDRCVFDLDNKHWQYGFQIEVP